MFEFDRDTALRRLDDTRFEAEVSEAWNIGTIPNGGYLLALCLAASSAVLPHPDPLTATAHYLGRVVPGEPVTVDVSVIRVGRTLSTASVGFYQGDRERIRVLTTYGDLGQSSGPTLVTASPPAMPPVDQCLKLDSGYADLEIQNRFDVRMAPDVAGGALGRPVGRAEVGGWIRFADGRPPDLAALALFADSFPPPVLNVEQFGWVPTIELTVHFRAHPANGWLRSWFTSRFIVESHLEEDGELWDEQGNLVALSRQLARILPRSS